jgi:hypothetical protein
VAPLRQKLIHGLACVVAIDLAIAAVVIDARSGSASASPVAAKAPVTSNGSVLSNGVGAGGGILGAAQFRHRRGVTGGTTGTPAAGSGSEFAAGTSSSVTTGPRSTGTTSGTAGRRPPTSGLGSTGTTGGTSGRSTNPTNGPSGPAGSPAGATADPGASGDGPTAPDPGGTDTPSGGTTTPSGGSTSPTTAPGSVHPTTTPPAKGPASQTVGDRAGDTTADSTGNALAQPQADIVKAQANWSAKAVVFAVQVAQPVNPAQDKNWAADSTYIDWLLDTNGDGGPDFEVQYYFDPKGGLVADVSRAGDTTGASVCPAEAGYTADGYTVAIDPACLGNPAGVSFRVTTYYNPDPSNPNGDLATDTSPDGGYSGPVSKP